MSRPLRVLTMVDSLFATGGAERMAAQLTLTLDRTRFEPHLVSTRRLPNPAWLEELAAGGVETLLLDRSRRIDLLAWRPLAALVRRRRIDVVHAHKFGSNVWAAVFGATLRVPVVVAHEHSWSFEGEPLRKLLDRHVVARGADVVLAVSEDDRRRMIEIERIPPHRIRVLPNAIPPLPEPERPDGVRAELGIPPHAPVVGLVAVVRPEKRHDLLLAAAAALRPRFPDLRVLLAGPGLPGRLERLQAAIAELGLEGVVLPLGLRLDVANVLAALDVAVICSDREGAPLAVIEYMAAGKAVVATRVGGLPDLVQDAAVLVPPGDAPALADAIGSLLGDPAQRADLGRRARRLHASRHSLDAVAAQVEELYEELFSRTARARREGWTPARRNAAIRSS